MIAEDALQQLERIASTTDFAARSADLTDSWEAQNRGSDVVAAILRFMEEHPSIDYGTPGPLIHFAERFYGQGYETLLLQSICRKPTPTTAGMLNALINGTDDGTHRAELIGVLSGARKNRFANDETIRVIDFYLRHIAGS